MEVVHVNHVWIRDHFNIVCREIIVIMDANSAVSHRSRQKIGLKFFTFSHP